LSVGLYHRSKGISSMVVNTADGEKRIIEAFLFEKKSL
jgi:hypothetical protein